MGSLMQSLEGQAFDGFEVQRKLGAGGMGSVYLARQTMLDRAVALKTMAPQLAADAEYVARFQREAMTAAKLSHPNIVQVYAGGRHDGAHYIAMEYVEGETLQARIERQQRIPPHEAVAVALYIAQALRYAWNTARLIHRDIKPDNIFLSTNGEVKLGDLGLAKRVGEGGAHMTSTGVAMGTPHYISPEQAHAEPDIDFRADIYSLGCTLFHMLAGHPPYQGKSALAVMAMHLTAPPASLAKAWPECPPLLSAAVDRMMARDRAQRPASYDDLVAMLYRVCEALQKPSPVALAAAKATPPRRVVVKGSHAPTPVPPVAAPSVESARPAAVKKSRVPLVLGAAAALFALAVAAVGLALHARRPPRAQPAPRELTPVPVPVVKPGPAIGATRTFAPLPGGPFTNAVGGEMVWIPAGDFPLGSTPAQRAAAVQNGLGSDDLASLEGAEPRKVRILAGFWLGRTEVTVGQWRRFADATGYRTTAERQGYVDAGRRVGQSTSGQAPGASWRDPHYGFPVEDAHPVTCVSWDDATAFTTWMTVEARAAKRLPEGRVFRLPTEVEWEYACRAGAETTFWWGEALEDAADRLNWVKGHGRDTFAFVSPVDFFGERGRNGFGLADMLGNVGEWCLDGFETNGARVAYQPGVFAKRVLRGGAFVTGSVGYPRCASRGNFFADRSYFVVGLRVCLAPAVGGLEPPTAVLVASSPMPDTAWPDAIDLLTLIDPQQDAVSGRWTRVDGQLVVDACAFARLQIPCRPPEEYDLRVVFSRQTGDDAIWHILAAGGRAFDWCLAGKNGKWMGFEAINGLNASNGLRANRIAMARNLENDRAYTSRIEVRKSGLRAFLDDRLVANWPTDYRDMSLSPPLLLRDTSALGLGAHNSATRFLRVELREVTGKSTFTRGPSAH